MLNKIIFKNYKSFKDRQELELKPITILIGKNSSGKSAITKLPILIERSLNKGIFPESLLLNNDEIELGKEFKDLIFGRTYGILDLGIEDEKERLNLKIATNTGTKDIPKIIQWKLNENLEVDGFEHEFVGFHLKNPENTQKIQSLSLNADYIGPFRELPKRSYNRPNINSQVKKVGRDGAHAYDNLILSSLSTDAILLKKVSNWYAENFDGWGIKVNNDVESYPEIELTRDNGKVNINLKDVGQGMSQTLPIVVRAFMPITDQELIIVEQPELHLHPSAHGNLAELFVSTIDKNKKYLIETHSQNFVLRLRRLIAEKKYVKGSEKNIQSINNGFTIDDLAIYYIKYDETTGTSNLLKINVDESGEVDFWPENIFNESLDEVMAIRKAQKTANEG